MFFGVLVLICRLDPLLSSYVLCLVSLALLFLNTIFYFWDNKRWDFYTLLIQFFIWLHLLLLILVIVKYFFLQCIHDLILKNLLTDISFQNSNLKIYFSLIQPYINHTELNNTIIVVNFDNLEDISYWVNMILKTKTTMAMNWVAPYLSKIFILNKAISANITFIIK